MIVALIGIDGAGKTTQARRLAHGLRASGLPATHWPNPGGRRTLDRLAERWFHRPAEDVIGVPGLSGVESLLRWLAIARALTLTRLRGGGIAVMDRYSDCQFANLRARGAPGEKLVRAAFAAFPRPDIVFLLLLPPAEAQRRIRDRGTDDEDLGHLVATDRAYRSLPEAGTYLVVDASGDPDQVAGTVRRMLRSHPVTAELTVDPATDDPATA